MRVRTVIETIPGSVVALIESLRRELSDPEFMKRHRFRDQDFTRDRQLTFPVVMLFILQKTAKSIQRHLHELFDLIAGESSAQPVTAGAFTHAALTEIKLSSIRPQAAGA